MSLSSFQIGGETPRKLELRSSSAEITSDARALAQALGKSPITAQILINRGCDTAESAQSFLSPSLRESLPNPHSIKNIGPCADLILEYVVAKRPITVFTDFDVDGVSAGSQLVIFLQAIGATVNSYTPSRFTEGYGLSLAAVEKLAKLGTQLLVTVDCGITSVAEIALAKKLGLQTIVIDHHLPQDLPDADVIVDPAQPDCPFQEYKLCAAGLVWMLLIVLRGKLRAFPQFTKVPDPKDFLDLAALGTLCDMVPLVKVNRIIAHRGLDALRATSRPGLVALKNVASVPSNHRLNSGHVGFGIGPRINAAGRMGDASEALELLVTKDSIRADSIARKIDGLNATRQREEAEIKEACIKLLTESETLLHRGAIALFGKEFHSGVIGIVAQRLVEIFYRPTAVLAPGEIRKGSTVIPVVKGSVRSIPGFHVADVLQSLDHLLVAHGGHAEAGGFTVTYEKLEAFQEAFMAAAEANIPDGGRQKRVLCDLEIPFKSVDYTLVEELQALAPFGIGNPAPLLYTKRVMVDAVSPVGQGHLRLRLSDGTMSQGAVAWNMQKNPLLRKGEQIAIAFSPELNSYQGVTSVQLVVREVWQTP